MSEFLVAPCPACDESVLLCHDLVGGELLTRCIHCDILIDRATAHSASADEIVCAGYTVPGHTNGEAGRGCRDGQCGVRQPER